MIAQCKRENGVQQETWQLMAVFLILSKRISESREQEFLGGSDNIYQLEECRLN
jgi:hypothetical protein